MNEFQNTILDTYPLTFFKSCWQAIFHLDSGANIHSSNKKDDFIILYPIKFDIHLAVGSTAQCEGVGAIITCLTSNTTLIIIAPVHYCPQAKASTLSPLALTIYKSIYDITNNIHTALEFKNDKDNSTHWIPIVVHSHLDCVSLPVLHLSTMTDVYNDSFNMNNCFDTQLFHNKLSIINIATIQLINPSPIKSYDPS